jgi:hypothetical protein
MGPRWPVFEAEANKQVVAGFFQNTVNLYGKLWLIHDFYVIETSHVKNEIKLLVFEDKIT